MNKFISARAVLSHLLWHGGAKVVARVDIVGVQLHV